MDGQCAQNVVVGLGEILWDLLPGGRQLGGAPANFAYHAKSLGAQGAVVSRVGEDELGEDILVRMREFGLDVECLTVDPQRPTGTVTVDLDQCGAPTYVIHEGVAWDYIEATEELRALAQRADAVCYGTLGQRNEVSREAIHAFLDATRPECLRVFDINLRQHYYSREMLERTLRKSAVVKLNDEELPVVARLLNVNADANQFYEALREQLSVQLMALTRGSSGSAIYSPSGQSNHEGYPVEVVDSVGAGDAFTAALTVGLLAGRDLDAINDKANRLAAYVCTQAGATPDMKGKIL